MAVTVVTLIAPGKPKGGQISASHMEGKDQIMPVNTGFFLSPQKKTELTILDNV